MLRTVVWWVTCQVQYRLFARRSTPNLLLRKGQQRAISCMTEEILNIAARNPFADASEESHDNTKVHIRVQQRNGRKCITTVAGLADDLDVKRILKAFKKNFSCNGAIAKDTELGQVIQLSGDQRQNVKDFLVDEEICVDGQIVVHGF